MINEDRDTFMSRASDNQAIIDRIKGLPAKEDDGTADGNPNVLPGWKDPTCPKCGLVLGNRMAYACQHTHCPVGLN